MRAAPSHKSSVLSVRLKPAEREAIRQAAAAAGYSGKELSVWARRALLRAARAPRPGDGRRPTLGRPPSDEPSE